MALKSKNFEQNTTSKIRDKLKVLFEQLQILGNGINFEQFIVYNEMMVLNETSKTDLLTIQRYKFERGGSATCHETVKQ